MIEAPVNSFIIPVKLCKHFGPSAPAASGAAAAASVKGVPKPCPPNGGLHSPRIHHCPAAGAAAAASVKGTSKPWHQGNRDGKHSPRIQHCPASGAATAARVKVTSKPWLQETKGGSHSPRAQALCLLRALSKVRPQEVDLCVRGRQKKR